jgi:hypothetical protein
LGCLRVRLRHVRLFLRRTVLVVTHEMPPLTRALPPDEVGDDEDEDNTAYPEPRNSASIPRSSGGGSRKARVRVVRPQAGSAADNPCRPRGGFYHHSCDLPFTPCKHYKTALAWLSDSAVYLEDQQVSPESKPVHAFSSTTSSTRSSATSCVMPVRRSLSSTMPRSSPRVPKKYSWSPLKLFQGLLCLLDLIPGEGFVRALECCLMALPGKED